MWKNIFTLFTSLVGTFQFEQGICFEILHKFAFFTVARNNSGNRKKFQEKSKIWFEFESKEFLFLLSSSFGILDTDRGCKNQFQICFRKQYAICVREKASCIGEIPTTLLQPKNDEIGHVCTHCFIFNFFTIKKNLTKTLGLSHFISPLNFSFYRTNVETRRKTYFTWRQILYNFLSSFFSEKKIQQQNDEERRRKFWQMWWTTQKRESNNDYYDDGIYMFSVCVSTHEMTNTKHTNDNELGKKWKKNSTKKGRIKM